MLKKKRYDFLCKNMEYTVSSIIKRNVEISNILISDICVSLAHSVRVAECQSSSNQMVGKVLKLIEIWLLIVSALYSSFAYWSA